MGYTVSVEVISRGCSWLKGSPGRHQTLSSGDKSRKKTMIMQALCRYFYNPLIVKISGRAPRLTSRRVGLSAVVLTAPLFRAVAGLRRSCFVTLLLGRTLRSGFVPRLSLVYPSRGLCQLPPGLGFLTPFSIFLTHFHPSVLLGLFRPGSPK